MCFQTKGYLWFSVYLLPRKDGLGPSLLFPLYDLVHEFRLPKVCYFPVRRSVLGSPYTSRGPYLRRTVSPNTDRLRSANNMFSSFLYSTFDISDTKSDEKAWKIAKFYLLTSLLVEGTPLPTMLTFYVVLGWNKKPEKLPKLEISEWSVLYSATGWKNPDRESARDRLANAEDLYSGSFRSWRKNKLDISIHIVNQSILEPNSPF